LKKKTGFPGAQYLLAELTKWTRAVNCWIVVVEMLRVIVVVIK
jgi:hypothetical protein